MDPNDPSRQEIKEIHQSKVVAFALFSLNQLIASVEIIKPNLIFLWNVNGPIYVRKVLTSHKSPVQSLTFNCRGQLLASLSGIHRQLLLLHEVTTGKEVAHKSFGGPPI